METTIREFTLCDFSKIRTISQKNILLLTNFVNHTSIENTIDIFQDLATQKPKLKIKGIYVVITLFNLGVVFAQRNQPEFFSGEKFREYGRGGVFGEVGEVGEVGGEKKTRLNFASRDPSGFLASSAPPTSPAPPTPPNSYTSHAHALCKKILSEYIEGIGWHDLQYISFLDFYNESDVKLHIVFNRITPEGKTIDLRSVGVKSFQYKVLEDSIKNLETPEKFLQTTAALHSSY